MTPAAYVEGRRPGAPEPAPTGRWPEVVVAVVAALVLVAGLVVALVLAGG